MREGIPLRSRPPHSGALGKFTPPPPPHYLQACPLSLLFSPTYPRGPFAPWTPRAREAEEKGRFPSRRIKRIKEGVDQSGEEGKKEDGWRRMCSGSPLQATSSLRLARALAAPGVQAGFIPPPLRPRGSQAAGLLFPSGQSNGGARLVLSAGCKAQAECGEGVSGGAWEREREARRAPSTSRGAGVAVGGVGSSTAGTPSRRQRRGFVLSAEAKAKAQKPAWN